MSRGAALPCGPRLVAVSHTGLYSGAEIVLERVLVRAASMGWSVTCCAPPGVFTDRLRAAGIDGPALPDLKLAQGRRAVAVLRAAGRAVQAALVLRRAAEDADIVLVNGVLALPAVRLARLRAPVVWIVHDYIKRADARAILRTCAPAVTLAIPVSASVAGPVEASGMAAIVVHNGTPWPVEPADAEPSGTPVVGCNALLTPWKGQSVLLEAVALLARDVEVELLGGSFPKDGPYRAGLEARIAQPDLAGRVRLLGHVTDPQGVMRRWTVAVSASVEPEAGPLSVIEAMSLGLPTVATAHGGTAEILGDAGILVPPGDAAALAGALDALLGDPDLRRRLSEAGRARVGASFTLEAKLDEVLSVLDDMAAEPPASPAAPAPPLRRRLRASAAATRVVAGGGVATPGAVVLAYHDVASEERPAESYSVTPAQLRAQLRTAQRAGVRFVDLAELTAAFLAGKNVDGLGAVVFDDGLVGVHHEALPVLADLEVPATVFVVTDVVGSSPPWWPNMARTMTRQELEEVRGAGVRIGAHTRTHPSLVACDQRQLRSEVHDSRQLLEDLAQAPVELFAYPFGDHDPAARNAVADAGFKAAYTFLNGRVVPGLDRLRLPRLTMGPHHGVLRLAYHLARPADAWADSQVDRWPPTA